MPFKKRKPVSVFFDLTKAFDKVWREGLQLKIRESCVSGKMYRWIRCFLHDRSTRVKLDVYLSKSVKMRDGGTQGAVIDILSTVHQQHHNCASQTCLQHPTRR